MPSFKPLWVFEAKGLVGVIHGQCLLLIRVHGDGLACVIALCMFGLGGSCLDGARLVEFVPCDCSDASLSTIIF